VSFAVVTLCVASQRVFIVVYFVIDSIRKLLDTPSYMHFFFQYYNSCLKRLCIESSSFELCINIST